MFEEAVRYPWTGKKNVETVAMTLVGAILVPFVSFYGTVAAAYVIGEGSVPSPLSKTARVLRRLAAPPPEQVRPAGDNYQE